MTNEAGLEFENEKEESQYLIHVTKRQVIFTVQAESDGQCKINMTFEPGMEGENVIKEQWPNMTAAERHVYNLVNEIAAAVFTSLDTSTDKPEDGE